MLGGWVRASFRDGLRGDDRRPQGSLSAQLDKPPILGRRTIRRLSLLSLAGIAYGSLIPFQPDPTRSWNCQLAWHAPVLADAIANFLLYVPVGIFACLMLRRRRSPGWVTCIMALLLAGGLSLLVESLQTMLPQRVASWTDVIANVGGAALGMLLAPAFQRVMRNQHAWLHGHLRASPFTAGAAAAVILAVIGGLAPFDVHPTPGHLGAAWQHLAAGPLWPWARETHAANGSMDALHAFDKLASAGMYGVVAFLLVLATVQPRRSMAGPAWYGLSRSLSLVVAIELLQMITISHVADAGDLLTGWLWAIAGTLGAIALLMWRQGALPSAAGVLRILVLLVGATILARCVAEWSAGSGPRVQGGSHWLPLAASFYRPWDSVLASYAAYGLRAMLVAGALALWYRTQGTAPSASRILLAALAWAGLEGGIALLLDRAWDTAGIPLSLLAGMVVLSVDRAFFGRSEPLQSRRSDRFDPHAPGRA